MPAGPATPAPAVLIVPGPGLTSRDGRTVGAPIDNLYKDLSKSFGAAGMATLRYDRRGSGASTLDPGVQALYKSMFSVDPLADAKAVKAPVMIALGEKSTSVFQDDAALLAGALGGRSEVVVAPNATATLQILKGPPRIVSGGDPSDMSSMGGGPIIADAPREQATLGRITLFLGASVGAQPA